MTDPKTKLIRNEESVYASTISRFVQPSACHHEPVLNLLIPGTKQVSTRFYGIIHVLNLL